MGFVKDVWNGITGKTAAKASEQAGNIQADASRYAADISQKQYEQTRQDQMPWLNAGKQALGQLQGYVGNNMQFGDAMGQHMHRQYNSGAYTKGLDAQSFYQDPSYQWRKQQGMDSLQAQAAAGGGLLSGATLKALNEHNSNLASQEYSNAWQRNMAENQNRFSVDSNLRSQDYNIFNSEDARQYNQLANLAGVGQQTANSLGAFGAQNAAAVGYAYTNAANAQANGLVGSANARLGGMGNLLNLGMKAAGMFI